MDSLRDAERKWSEVMQCKQKEKDLEEKVIEISTERLKGFKNHPFKVKMISRWKLSVKALDVLAF